MSTNAPLREEEAPGTSSSFFRPEVGGTHKNHTHTTRGGAEQDEGYNRKRRRED